MKYIASLCIIILLIGCGPGAGDGSTNIGYGYVFEMSGGDATYIQYVGNESEKGAVIPSRVEQFHLYDDWIFVSRMPRQIYQEGDVTESKIIQVCEYWVINGKTHEVKGPFEKAKLSGIQEWVALNKSDAAKELASNGLRCPLVN